jgi:protein-tyrosine phosphatase
MTPPFVDVHCHLLPGVDDGASDLAVALAMAEMAVADGIRTVVATPHQSGAYAHNRGPLIRQCVADFQRELDAAGLPLAVMPGGDVRIEGDLIAQLAAGDVLTLADRGRHVLLELPHELYFPLAGLLEALRRRGVVGVLSHPERNAGLMAQPHLVAELVDQGCLMQVTAGSLTGAFGPRCQALAEWLLAEGLVHMLATDAHGVRSRRPLLRRAFDRIVEVAGAETAADLCCRHPARVAAGDDVPGGRRSKTSPTPRRGWRRFFSPTKAA